MAKFGALKGWMAILWTATSSKTKTGCFVLWCPWQVALTWKEPQGITWAPSGQQEDTNIALGHVKHARAHVFKQPFP